VLATLGGLAGGIALVMGGPRLRRSLTVLVQVLRAIPVLMLIFWCYFPAAHSVRHRHPRRADGDCRTGTDQRGLSEPVGSGWHRSHRQRPVDGWRCAGHDRWQTLRYIILPPALRHMLPSFINQWITLLKDSSLAYVVGVAEFTLLPPRSTIASRFTPAGIRHCRHCLSAAVFRLEWSGRRLAGNAADLHGFTRCPAGRTRSYNRHMTGLPAGSPPVSAPFHMTAAQCHGIGYTAKGFMQRLQGDAHARQGSGFIIRQRSGSAYHLFQGGR
jgi:polar amino acid transport system permease protein